MEEKLKSMTEITISVDDVITLSYVLQVLHGLEGMSQGKVKVKVVRNDFAGQGADANEGLRGADMPPVVSVPSELDTPDMRELLDQLVEQGVLGEGYQLKNQSWTEKSVIVAFLSGKAGKRCMWSAFAELWACDKNALQSAYSKHCDTMAARKYYQKLTHILD